MLSVSPDEIKLDPVSDSIAVYDREEKVLEVHNLQKREQLLRLDNVDTDLEPTFDRRGDNVFWVDRKQRQLNKSDMSGNLMSLNLGRSGAGLSAMTRSVDGSTGFISDREANRVYVVGLRNLALLAEVKTGENPGKACGTADGLTMLVPNTGSNTLTAFSTFTFEPLYTVKTIENPVSINPAWLDATAAVIGASGDVDLVDLETGQSRKTFKLHGEPRRGVVTHNSRIFLLPVSGYASVVLFDMETLAIVERIVDLPGDIGDLSAAVYSDQCS